MRSGSHVQLAALRNRDLELQTASPFSNHGSVERPTVCFRHKNVLQKQWYVVWKVWKFPSFCVSLYIEPGPLISIPIMRIELILPSKRPVPIYRQTTWCRKADYNTNHLRNYDGLLSRLPVEFAVSWKYLIKYDSCPILLFIMAIHAI